MKLKSIKTADRIWDRSNKRMIESKVYGKSILKFLHKTIIGQFLMRFLFSTKASNEIITLYNYSKSSIKGISQFVSKYNLNINEIEKPLEEYKSFADFFIRRLKPGARKIDQNTNTIIAPCDSLIQAVFMGLTKDTKYEIKGNDFLLSKLIRNDQMAEKYIGGSLIVFYLAPYNIHHFIYPVSGILKSTKSIGESYFSVNSISLENGFRPFDFNKRDVSVIQTETLGEVIMVEVGGFYAGKIIQENIIPGSKTKGDPKGYFALGGSTIVLVFEEGKVVIDDDLVEIEKKDYIIALKQGERLGELKKQNVG